MHNIYRAAALIPALLIACGGSGDGVVEEPATEFQATLDIAQEVPPSVVGVDLTVTATNNAPAQGTFQTPVWFGIHDGTFDIYDRNEAADLFNGDALERIAEDGTTGPITDAFSMADVGHAQGVLAGPNGPLAPGDAGSATVRINPDATTSRYFSYASMVIPSNDAFIANGSPVAHVLFNAAGALSFTPFAVPGSEVLDAGTEVNDELPANTAFFGQAAPDTGVDENGVVVLHPGFMAAGSGGILDDAMFANGNFLAMGYETAAFTVAITDANPTPPSGTATFTLRADGVTLDYDITAQNLSGPLVAAHFHEAPAGQAGPVLFDIGANIVQTDGNATIQGNVVLNDEQLAALRAGNLYINLHTALNRPGEIRGQILTSNGG